MDWSRACDLPRRCEAIRDDQADAVQLAICALANGQEPLALFITCSDSRVVPSLISLADPGELFVVRNVANLVPPNMASGEGGESGEGDASVTAAVWYALEVLKIRDVVVCGHSGCGGVKALLGPPPPSAALRRWLAPAASAVDAWRKHGPLDPSFAEHDQLSQISTLIQLDNLATHDHVRARVEAGDVRLHAWWFDIPTARLLAHSKAAGRYVSIVEADEEHDATSLSPRRTRPSSARRHRPERPSRSRTGRAGAIRATFRGLSYYPTPSAARRRRRAAGDPERDSKSRSAARLAFVHFHFTEQPNATVSATEGVEPARRRRARS